jgi:hypothetical protein
MARKKAAAKPQKPKYQGHGQVVYDLWRNPAALQRHLDEGHDINAPDSEGQTLLVLACVPTIEALSRGSDTLVKQLLQAGADPDALI